MGCTANNYIEMQKEELIELVLKLVKEKPKLQELSECLDDFNLNMIDSLSSDQYDFYKGSSNQRELKGVMLDVRMPKNSGEEYFVSLEINQLNGISTQYLQKQFGKNVEFKPARPSENNGLDYYIYNIDETRISFGFPVNGNDSDVDVIIIRYK